MSTVTVTARSDPTQKTELLEINGRRFAVRMDEKVIRNIPHLKLRDNDVMICGFMRAGLPQNKARFAHGLYRDYLQTDLRATTVASQGTHWSFEIINMLIRGTTETIPERKESLHLEQASQEKIDTFPSPRVLSSHLFFDELPREVIDRRTKIVYLVRDPRDSLASWYTCQRRAKKSTQPNWNMPLCDWLELSNNGELGWGSWFENIESWERAQHEHPDDPILVVYYEDLTLNTDGEIIRIKNFLGEDRDDEFCERVADKTQFEKMAKDKDKYTEKFGGQAVHYNKGIIGNWKTMFTVSMSEEFDQLYERKMSRSRFRDRYSRSGARR